MRVRLCLVVLSLVVLVLPGLADAQDGGWIVRGRIVSVSPNDSSTTIGDTGTHVTVDSDIIPELDITYMFNQHLGLEVIAGTSKHDLATDRGALGGANAGSVRVLPPTFTLQYHTGYRESLDFYCGLGLNYTLFYSYDLSDDLAGLGIADVDFSSSFGLSAQLGLDVAFGDNWVFNIDAKYIDMSTDADLVLGDGSVLDTLSVDINPWVFGVGVGYRF